MAGARSIVVGSLRALSVAVVFVVALVAGVIAHLDAAPTRRAVAARVSAVLATTFEGKISIERIGHLTLAGVDDARVVIDDPSGRHVIVADGVSARLTTTTLVRSLFASTGPLTIELANASVRDAEVSIDEDDAGQLLLARTFVLRPARATSSPPTHGRGVSFSIRNVAIAHGRVRGQPHGAPAIDAEIGRLAASLDVLPTGVTIDVGRFDLTTHAMPHDANAVGVAEGSITVPSPTHHGVGIRASWNGTIGAIAESATFAYDGSRFDAVVDAPAVAPTHVRLLWPDSPLEAPTTVHAEAHGPLTALDVQAHVGVADGAIDLSATASIANEKSAKVHVDARAIDLKAIVETLPPSDVALSADAAVTMHADGSLSGDATVEIARGTVASAPVPPTTVSATVARDAAGQLIVDGKLTPHEPGVESHADIHVRPKGGSLEVAFDARASAPRLESVAPLGGGTRGNASAHAEGTLDVGARRIDAKLDARGGGISHGSLDIGNVELTATATGPLGAPVVHAELRADDLAAGTTKAQSLRASVSGTIPHLRATASLRARSLPDVDLHADVDLESVTTIRNVDAVLSRNGERAHATASAVKVGGGALDAENLAIEGVGAPARVSIRVAPQAIALRAVSTGLDIGRLARLLGVHETIDGDTAAFDIDATLRDGGADGHIGAKISRLAIRGVGDVAANIDATMSGHHAVGKAHVELGDVGSIDVAFKHVTIGHGATPAAALRATWGSFDFSGRADLSRARALLPNGAPGIGDLSGEVAFDGHVMRDSPTDDTPELHVSAYTSRLLIAAPSIQGAAPSWHFAGTELGLDARIDGDSGAAEIALRAQDAKGVLVSVDAKATELPYTKLLGAPDHAMDLIAHAPLQARIDVPRRSADDFPQEFAPGDARGDLAASFVVAGTFGKPSVDGMLTFDHARSKLAPIEMPLDLTATLHYDAVRADLKVGADVRSRRVMDAEVVVDAAFSDLVDTTRRDPMPWTGSAHAHVDGFPLQALGTLGDREVRGNVVGDLTIDGIHEDGRAKVSLDLTALSIGDVSYPKAWLRVGIDGEKLDASGRLEQTDGFAEVHARAGTQWGRSLRFHIDGTKPIEVSAEAKALRASAFLPFAAGVLTELDGRIDGSARAELDPISKKGTSHGTLALTDGQIEIAAMGGELRDVAASLAWTPDGVIQIQRATAHVLSGEVDASGTIDLDGPMLSSAKLIVDVPKKKRLPLTVEGVQLATLDGHFVLDAKSAGDDHAITATVDVPTLHVDIPVTGTRSAQKLGKLDHVNIGVHGTDAQLHALGLDAPDPKVAKPPPKGAAPVTVTIKLGSDVEIRRGTDLKVSLEGEPVVKLGAVTRVAGQIRLPHGSIAVEGKQFTIEKGTVSFVGDDPTNPQVVLTARWLAPEGTSVYADFVGPLATGKVTLRSDPTHTKSEILALLLYGTADGQAGATSDVSSNAAANGAAGAAGGLATQPVNRILDDFGLAGGVSTKIDTSTANPRPEVEFQIARDISLQIAWVLGAIPLGTNPDTTLVTFDWRFLQQWSLETTVGDAGTSVLDVVWQYHY